MSESIEKRTVTSSAAEDAPGTVADPAQQAEDSRENTEKQPQGAGMPEDDPAGDDDWADGDEDLDDEPDEEPGDEDSSADTAEEEDKMDKPAKTTGRNEAKDRLKKAEKFTYTQNRELSWLRFNQRVLEEAGDKSLPLLERLKFVSIFSSNLDEFFMVRVGSLFDKSQVSPDERDNKTGMNAAQQLDKVYDAVHGLMSLKAFIYQDLLRDMEKKGIVDVAPSRLTDKDREAIRDYFAMNILPVISPMVIDKHHPVPHLGSKKLYVAAHLVNGKGKGLIGLVAVPSSIPPYIKLPGEGLRYIRTENIIREYLPSMFNAYSMLETCVISVTRNADISFDDEKFEDEDMDILENFSHMLRMRNKLSVVRLEVSESVSRKFMNKLEQMVDVDKRQVFEDGCPLVMKYAFSLADKLPEEEGQKLLYKPYTPRWPEDLNASMGMIEQIQAKDRMLFYPFDSVEPFLRLLMEAADREDVISIKITLYRLASTSKIARALCHAAENGKEVIVLMELRARFDEANNISWARVLEDAGCVVIYGIENYNCHSKLCQITMNNKGKLSYVTQVGTGNYNEKTNDQYTDLCLMTAKEEIGEDATVFFQNMMISNLNGHYNHLLASPTGIKPKLLELMDEQMALGSDGYICIKANSVTEREVIDMLMEASRAGVEIHLIIRGICCILPGVKGYTENIHVTSIVGRYLEHARIYCFGRDNDVKLYISSADLMTRNLNRRVEIACPVYDPDLKAKLEWILSAELRDDVKSSVMLPNGKYSRNQPSSVSPCSSQDEFMKVSIHDKAPMQEKVEKKGFFSKLKGIFG